MSNVRRHLEQEAQSASRALATLTDEGVADALLVAAELTATRAVTVLEANRSDVSAATGRLDEGALDRLRLGEQRLEAIAAQLRALAALPPLEREIDAWTLDNGLRVQERRIAVGQPCLRAPR